MRDTVPGKAGSMPAACCLCHHDATTRQKDGLEGRPANGAEEKERTPGGSPRYRKEYCRKTGGPVMVLGLMEGVGTVVGEQHRFPVRFWITVFSDRRGVWGKEKVELPSLEAVKCVEGSRLALELENGQSMDVLVKSRGDDLVMSVESTGKVPGY